jgi:hypothetical protein
MMTSDATLPAVNERPSGRGLFWTAIGLCALGVLLVIVQFSLKQLIVPWYVPALTTWGMVLMFRSMIRHRTIPRILCLAVIGLLAGFQWYALISLVKLPEYRGPAQAGQQLPAFQTTLADGTSFTEKSLQDGTPTVMTFFRGRW